ncbi:hypothetical protein HPB52_004667 [Rhipicephalus sanguineus]|uniref:MULE transposase domain-containing protein n=1 Tax=Rhipicephalus sanguineus TaxID=34632 RepID=A0A9D4T4Z7_RHISA|nr:hypothetical protein HPB52_004667 [Rhipicephalus sanguineus]
MGELESAKLRDGVTMDAVLDDVRSNLDDTLHRINLLTKQDHQNLVTVLCVDEFGNGFSVAYCVINHTDRKAMLSFFMAIISKTGPTTAKAFMTDDAPEFYNAWQQIMGLPQHRLLCTWHVDKGWREAINKRIHDKILKAFTYKVGSLCVVVPSELSLLADRSRASPLLNLTATLRVASFQKSSSRLGQPRPFNMS